MTKGSNSSGLRRYNERVLLTSLRRLGTASKVELARLSNLTPQAATRIIDDLEQAGLVRQQGKRKGGLGQPSTLYAINPQGAYSIGVNVGRRDIQLLLMDFGGVVIEKLAHEFERPEPDFLLDQIERGIKDLSARLDPREAAKLVGVGVAMPWFMGAWTRELNMSEALAQQWNTIDFGDEVARRTHLSVFFENDCSAATIAELLFGRGVDIANFLYAFVGTFIGGGVVLQGNLESGVHGNSGALASMPVPPSTLASAGAPTQPFETLANRASLFVLRRHLNASGFPIQSISELPDLPPQAGVLIDEWVEDCAAALTFAMVSATGVLDFEAIVIDGNLPRPLVADIVARVDKKLRQAVPSGVFVPRVLAGKTGADARAIGGAILPFYANFSPDKTVMLTGGVPERVSVS
jgi:predicted NBD/HSP70 family sugar kinase